MTHSESKFNSILKNEGIPEDVIQYIIQPMIQERYILNEKDINEIILKSCSFKLKALTKRIHPFYELRKELQDNYRSKIESMKTDYERCKEQRLYLEKSQSIENEIQLINNELECYDEFITLNNTLNNCESYHKCVIRMRLHTLKKRYNFGGNR